tara:strand:+ start:2241 stop:2438 length:198 start_codon:yes stop_codon:yes gene_type:complete
MGQVRDIVAKSPTEEASGVVETTKHENEKLGFVAPTAALVGFTTIATLVPSALKIVSSTPLAAKS